MSTPNLKEIEWAISELENEETSFSNYEKLAALYTVRDKMMGVEPKVHMEDYSRAAGPEPKMTERYGDSDFLTAVSGKDLDDVFQIMDDLMENLKIVNERVYMSVMRKIRAL